MPELPTVEQLTEALAETVRELGYIDIHVISVDKRGDVMDWGRGLRVDHVAAELHRQLSDILLRPCP